MFAIKGTAVGGTTPPPSGDATLSGLTVTGGGSDLVTFVSGTTDYTAMVTNDVETLTFASAKNDDGASVAYLDSDGNPIADADTAAGHQVPLDVGANVITVRVTAEDGTTQDYTVTVTRAEPLPTVTVAAAIFPGETVAEGADAAFSLSRTGSTTAALTVTVTVSQTGAVLKDASAVPSSVTFAAGAATATLALETDDDDTDDDAGTVTVTLGTGTGYTVGEPGAATVAVSDNDVPVDFVLAVPATVAEDAGPATVTVTATTAENAPPATLVEVQLARVGGTATGGSDYDAVSETVRFQVSDFAPATVDGQPRYQAEWTHAVVIHDDEVVEDDETVVLEMSPTSAFLLIHTLQGAHDAVQATLTIVDNDTAAVSFGAGSYSVDEGGTVEVTVQLDAAPGREVVVPVSAAGAGGATPPGETGADWSGVPENVTFGATDTEQTFTLAATDDADVDAGAVATEDDTLDEPDEETFTLTLSSPSNATLGEATATGTITDNDDPPTLGVADAAATEGAPVEFTVTLSAAATADVTATWTASTIEGDEEKAAAADLESTTGPVTVPKGETTATFTVATAEDALDENDETFTVALSGVSSNATLAADATTATGTITDDDDRPLLYIADADANEDSAVEFTVSLSAASGRTVGVGWGVDTSGTASDADLTGKTLGVVTFPPGMTTAQFEVAVVDDELVERDETFVVNLGSATNARIAENTATGTIVDNDVAPNAAPAFTSSDTFTPAENQTAAGTVRAADSDGDAITDYALSGGADQALFSIGSTSGALTFLTAPNYENPQDATPTTPIWWWCRRPAARATGS